MPLRVTQYRGVPLTSSFLTSAVQRVQRRFTCLLAFLSFTGYGAGMSVAVQPDDLAAFIVAARNAIEQGVPVSVRAGNVSYRLSGDLATAIVALLDAQARGETLEIESLPAELTTGQAADLLGVSRPTVVSLIDRGDLPAHRIGTHRRLRLQDVLAYRARAREQRHAALDELTAVSEELGLYDGS
jgi:excisionase family DNA binding protein